MKLRNQIMTVLAVSTIGVTPLALAGGALAHPGKTHTHTTPSDAKAYGKFCRGESKKHVKGQKRTPFSECVVAMAHVAKGTNPVKACATESKRHVNGQKGTPFSDCVADGKKLQKMTSPGP
jgi:hypothetical protein